MAGAGVPENRNARSASIISGIKVALGELELEQRENFCKGGRHENHLEVRRSSKNG